MATPAAGYGDRSSTGLWLGGWLLIFAGFGLLTSSVLTDVIPPTFGGLAGAFLAFFFGAAALVMGVGFLQAAGAERPVVSEQGLSVKRDPITDEREWIPLAQIRAVRLRRWPLSPWIRGMPFAVLEVEQVDKDLGSPAARRYLVRVQGGGARLVKKLQNALGERFANETHVG